MSGQIKIPNRNQRKANANSAQEPKNCLMGNLIRIRGRAGAMQRRKCYARIGNPVLEKKRQNNSDHDAKN